MRTQFLRRRIPLAIPVLSVVALAAICCSATAIAARGASRPSSLAGTWSGSYSGAYTGTFRLHWTQSKGILSGSIVLSNPQGKYGITGSVRGTAIHFGVVGAGATYTGSVSGKTMSGKYKTPTGGGSWSAHKTSR
jgi:hypothetical protein